MANPSDMDPNEFLMGAGGYRSASFKQYGASVTGFVVRTDMRQQSDPATGELKTWNDGSPRMQMRIVLRTEERDPSDEDDNGDRAIYARGQMRQAIADAVKLARKAGLEIGGKLRVTYVRDGAVTARGLNAPKEYEAQYRGPEAQPVPVQEPARAAANGGNGQPAFDPQPVPRVRDEAPPQPVHNPAPF